MCSQNPTCFGVGHHHRQGRSTYDKIMHRLLTFKNRASYI